MNDSIGLATSEPVECDTSESNSEAIHPLIYTGRTLSSSIGARLRSTTGTRRIAATDGGHIFETVRPSSAVSRVPTRSSVGLRTPRTDTDYCRSLPPRETTLRFRVPDKAKYVGCRENIYSNPYEVGYRSRYRYPAFRYSGTASGPYPSSARLARNASTASAYSGSSTTSVVSSGSVARSNSISPSPP